jgi:FixJ family two-component response regulator
MIYFIDDDKSVRRGFELFLKSAGMEYKTAESVEDFLSQFQPGINDLIVLDLILPGITGCQLLEKFISTGIHLPVIVVTSLDDQLSKECCKRYGVKAFLRKPVDSEALIDLIKYNT